MNIYAKQEQAKMNLFKDDVSCSSSFVPSVNEVCCRAQSTME
jgi:hypothetical protein